MYIYMYTSGHVLFNIRRVPYRNCQVVDVLCTPSDRFSSLLNYRVSFSPLIPAYFVGLVTVMVGNSGGSVTIALTDSKLMS